jgi:hypothetical protein
MYTLLALLALLALVLYTPNWGLYLGAATGLAAVACALRRPDTRRALNDVGLTFAAVALL